MMVEIEHLSKYFGPVLAVSDVSLRIGRNEIVGLLGNNGAGKSTLMRMLTTFLPATSGRITVDGFDVLTQSQDVRRRIGYLPESIPLYPEMRVEEYLRYRAQLKGLDRGKVRPRIENVLGRCRLGDVRRRQCGTLSKGFRQRVGLADALLAEPALLILDEPTDGLDPGQKQEALALLRVGDFRVELQGVKAALLVRHAGDGRAIGGGDELETRRQRRDLVAMAHPDIQQAVTFG